MSNDSSPTRKIWRNRLFWAWQAWRLRKLETADSGGGVNVFNNFAALRHRGYIDALFDLHNAMSAATPGLSPAQPEEFQRRLIRELNNPACMALFTQPDGRVGGYAWGRIAKRSEALDLLQQTPSLAHLGSDDWLQLASRLRTDVPLLLCKELGLDVRYRRGFAPLKHLLKPLLDLALRHGARRALWWVPRNSPLRSLSAGFGARPVFETETVSFFLLGDIRPLARIFATLPAGDISARLARLVPRAPAPPRPAALQRPVAVPTTPRPAAPQRHAAVSAPRSDLAA
jgi:hypothetical protein